MLALKKTPVGPGDRAKMTAIPNLPEPSRLPRRPSYVPASLPTDGAPFPALQHELAFTVSGVPAAFAASAGVAIYDQDDHFCAFAPLTAGRSRGADVHLVAKVPSDAPLRVAVAIDEAHARRSYWLATTIAADWPADRAVPLAAGVQEVVLRTGALPPPLASALRVRRRGDSQWAPTDTKDTAAATPGELHYWLGPGEYEVTPWSEGNWKPVVVTVPGPRDVVLTFAP